MLADPQSVTISGTPVSLPAVSRNGASSVYRSADGNHQLTVTHSSSRANDRIRHEIRLDKTVVAADPVSAVNKSVQASVYLVINEPAFGFTDADLGAICSALTAFCTTGTISKVLGGES